MFKAFALHLISAVHVVSKDVGVFKNTSAFHQLLVCCLEKFHISPLGIIRGILQLYHAVFCLLELLLGKVLSFLVCMVALVVVQVPVQITLGFRRIGLVGLVVNIRSTVVFVALVVPTRIGTMLVPVAHANPAKFVLAPLTGHVIATLILLDSADALGTRFGVGEDPVRRFRLVAAFFVPSSQFFARTRRVGFYSADQTKVEQTMVAMRNATIRFHRQCRFSTSHTFTPATRTPASQGV
mmetsp:Transcript_18768/g.37657  ORF Transcript_18768/g.37657 Transcript_18768/m.37657 type:complete len:239 (-) Transcript_18768:555-1271(-)